LIGPTSARKTGSAGLRPLMEEVSTATTSSLPPPPSRAGSSKNPASAQKRNACRRRHDEWGRGMRLHLHSPVFSGAGIPIHDVNQQGGRTANCRLHGYDRNECQGLNSDQLKISEADMALAANNDVVVHENPKFFSGLHDPLGHVDVGMRGRGITRGVVVHQDDRRR
jgi:hypothetical protein